VFACLAILLIAGRRSRSRRRPLALAQTLRSLHRRSDQADYRCVLATSSTIKPDSDELSADVRQEFAQLPSLADCEGVEARFAPSAADMAVVRQHLAAHNLKVVSTDKLNHAVTAPRQRSRVERAAGRATEPRVHQWRRAPRCPPRKPWFLGCRESGRRVQAFPILQYENYARRMVAPTPGSRVDTTLHRPRNDHEVLQRCLPSGRAQGIFFQYQRTFPTLPTRALARRHHHRRCSQSPALRI